MSLVFPLCLTSPLTEVEKSMSWGSGASSVSVTIGPSPADPWKFLTIAKFMTPLSMLSRKEKSSKSV